MGNERGADPPNRRGQVLSYDGARTYAHTRIHAKMHISHLIYKNEMLPCLEEAACPGHEPQVGEVIQGRRGREVGSCQSDRRTRGAGLVPWL